MFSNQSNSRFFRILIAWIQPMKLRKQQFDRLEKIQHFSKWAKIRLYNFGLFQQVFENLKLNKLIKEDRRLDLEDWSLEKRSFEAAFWRMNLKACTFERLAFISLGFGRGAQVGKTSLLEVEFISTAQASTLGVFNFFNCYASGPGILPKPSIFARRRRIFFTMRSEDSETAHLLGSGPVLRHNNTRVRDVLTAPSNVYLNLGLNLFHTYF